MVKKEEILARTSNGLDVFRHYLPVKWRVGRNFLNPLYADSKACKLCRAFPLSAFCS